MKKNDQQLQASRVAIFKGKDGKSEVQVKLDQDTAWLTQKQLSELFEKDRSVITKHIRNILKDEELDNSVCAKFAHTGEDGKVYQTQYYNLDMIISLGYRINSKRGIEFRRWASTILKEYLINGYSLNKDKLKDKQINELKQAIELLSNTLISQDLVSDEGRELLELIKNYSKTWELLIRYDENNLKIPKVKGAEDEKKLDVKLAQNAVHELRELLVNRKEASNLFGQEKNPKVFDGIIASIYQTFAGEDLYPTLAEKAAHLIYFIIKNHPFTDGNKRIGAMVFLLFINKYKKYFIKITPQGLTSLALLIAESNPSQKDLLIKLTMNLITKDI